MSIIIPEPELHTAYLICNILFVKNAACLLDSSSGGTDDVGFVSLSTTEKSVRALLQFLLMISQKYDCLAFFGS